MVGSKSQYKITHVSSIVQYCCRSLFCFDGWYILNLTFLFCFIILLAEIDSDLYLQQPFISNISVTYDRSEVISMVL